MKRNFAVTKRFAAFAISVAVMVLGAATILAAENKTVEKGDPVIKRVTVYSERNEENAVFGKQTEDVSLKVKGMDEGHYRTFYQVNPGDTYTSCKYLVYEMNIAPVYGVKSVYLQTKSSARVSEQATTFNNRQWNHFMFVYEVPTESNPKGRTTCYVNGEEVFADIENINAFSGTDVRIAIDSTATQKSSDWDEFEAYIDDINVYLTDSEVIPAVMPALPSSYKVNGNILTVDDYTLAGAIKADGINVKAFRGETALTGSEELLKDDTVILEAGSNPGEMKYTTYKVLVVSPEINNDWAKDANPSDEVSKELLANFSGKTEADNLYKITLKDDKTAGNINRNWNYIGAYRGYLVIEGNAYINGGSFSVRLGNSPVLEYDKHGEWFHFMTVIDKSVSENNVAAYINGNKVKEYTLTVPASANARLRLGGKGGDSIVLDDVRFSAQKNAPVITQLPQAESLLFGKYINGAGKIAADFGGENISAIAFETTDLAAEMNTDSLCAGNYVLLYDSVNRVYNGYRVAELENANGTISYKYPEACAIIIAEYSGDTLVDIKTAKTDGSVTAVQYTPASADNTVRIFTWDSLNRIKPLEASF